MTDPRDARGEVGLQGCLQPALGPAEVEMAHTLDPRYPWTLRVPAWREGAGSAPLGRLPGLPIGQKEGLIAAGAWHLGTAASVQSGPDATPGFLQTKVSLERRFFEDPGGQGGPASSQALCFERAPRKNEWGEGLGRSSPAFLWSPCSPCPTSPGTDSNPRRDLGLDSSESPFPAQTRASTISP